MPDTMLPSALHPLPHGASCLQKKQCGDRYHVPRGAYPARSAVLGLSEVLDCKICVLHFKSVFMPLRPGHTLAYIECTPTGKLQLCAARLLHICCLCLLHEHSAVLFAAESAK